MDMVEDHREGLPSVRKPRLANSCVVCLTNSWTSEGGFARRRILRKRLEIDGTREGRVDVRARCTFCSGVAFTVFFDLGSNALRDRVERCKLVRDPTTLYESHWHRVNMLTSL